jgi:protein phosphatase
MKLVRMGPIEFELAAFSEQGPRPENQDAYSIDAFADKGLVALADGMGGEKSGRVAADTALEALTGSARIRTIEDGRRAAREADRRVIRTAETDSERLGGMGCALGFLALSEGGDGPAWISGHTGDVRILSRSPDGVLRLETRDHTPAFSRWENGEITLDEIPDSVGANRLQRAIGRGGEAEVNWLPAAAGWSWLIISDGVYKAMRMDEIGLALASATTEDAAEAIRNKVAERGADDNYTAVVVRARGGPAAAVPPPTSAASMPHDSTPAERRPGAAPGIALALAVLAMVLAIAAFWTDRERDTQLEQLQTRVDSLGSMVRQMVDPFGLNVPASTVAPGTLESDTAR